MNKDLNSILWHIYDSEERYLFTIPGVLYSYFSIIAIFYFFPFIVALIVVVAVGVFISGFMLLWAYFHPHGNPYKLKREYNWAVNRTYSDQRLFPVFTNEGELNALRVKYDPRKGVIEFFESDGEDKLFFVLDRDVEIIYSFIKNWQRKYELGEKLLEAEEHKKWSR